MSQGSQVDYAALAKQAGAVSSQPPAQSQGRAVDYAALAKQAGAINSTPPAVQSPSVWQQVKDALAPRSALDMPGAKTFAEGSKELPGNAEGANLAAGLSEWDKASGGELLGGASDIVHGNVARGGHRMIQGVGAATVPVLPFLAPLAAANPVAFARVAAGGLGGQFIGQKGAEALGANPDQAALAGDIGGLGGGYGAAKLPAFLSKVSPSVLRTGAGQAFNAVSDVAGSNPVSAEGAGQAALSAQDLQNVGRTMPRVMQKFLQRVTAPDAEPLSYDEARRFYSAAGELSANEQASYTPAMKRALNQFKAQLGQAIQQTADNAGVGTEYGQAMTDYAKAARLHDTWETVWGAAQKHLIPGLIKGLGVGAGGAAVYGTYRALSK
jgi:hypothetical protein